MERDETSDPQFMRLQSLAASDPRQARQILGQLLDSGQYDLGLLFGAAAAPGEGRLRQLIANTVRVRGEQHRFVAHLQAWREVEPDEFTRRALDAALEGIRPVEKQAEKRSSLIDARLVESYRYVSDRLKHQVRNSLMEPMGQLIRLRDQVDALNDVGIRGELSGHVAALNDALVRVGRIIEFDASDEHFEMRSVALTDWLRAFNDEYARKYSAVSLRITPADPWARILASDFLLGIVFWNLWINSQQAVGRDCSVTVRVATSDRSVELQVEDNGEGFSREDAESGLPDAVPRQGHRGRGLLEVQEAMERLHGGACLVRAADGSFRIKLTFPKEV